MALQGSMTLTRVFLSLASDPTTVVVCGTSGSMGGGGSRQEVTTLTGDFRQFANGNTRLITGTGKSVTNAMVLRALSTTQVNTVKSMAGKTCLFRDTYGRRTFCSFLVTNYTDIPLSGLCDVGITLREITYTEAV